MTAPQFDPNQLAAFLASQQAQAPAPQFPQFQQAPQMPQGYAPQMPQGYAQPQVPQAPAPVNASLDDFFSQPSSGWGPAWSFKDKPVGTTFVGVVARPVTNGDVSQQTTPGNNPQPMFYKDGRPKLVMKVAMQVQPDQTFPEGKAQWYVQGGARDELARAMAEAGAPAGPPEKGALISVTLSGQVPNTFGTKTNQYTVKYQRPEGAAAPAPVDPALSQVAQQAAQPQPAAPQVPAPAAPPAAEAPAGLDPAKAALLAQLTGQAQS